MISEFGNENQYNHSSENFISFVQLGFLKSIDAINNFMYLLGYDKELLSHLEDINVIIDYTDDFKDNKACYYSNEDGKGFNSIHIAANYLDELLTTMDICADNLVVKYNSINELATTIVHELIHSNRDIMINDSINLNNLAYYQEKLFNYNDIVLNENFYGVASDNLWDYDIDITKLSKDEIIEYRNKLINQIGIEEALTEAFAKIVIFHKNKKDLKIREFCDLELAMRQSDDMKCAYYLIKKMNLDTIRWFFTSCYEDCYRNEFKTLFGSDYDKVIKHFVNFYNHQYDKPHQEAKCNKLLRLIDKNMIKK